MSQKRKPLLFRPNGEKFQPAKTVAVFYNAAEGRLSVNGVSISAEMLMALAPTDESIRGPFWIKREGDVVEMYELEEIHKSEDAYPVPEN